jgi:hypothetical protein
MTGSRFKPGDAFRTLVSLCIEQFARTVMTEGKKCDVYKKPKTSIRVIPARSSFSSLSKC